MLTPLFYSIIWYRALVTTVISRCICQLIFVFCDYLSTLVYSDFEAVQLCENHSCCLQEEATESQNMFDSEKQKMTGEVAQMLRSLDKEKGA